MTVTNFRITLFVLECQAAVRDLTAGKQSQFICE